MGNSPQELYDLAMVLYEESRYVEAIDLFKDAADQGHLPSAEKLAKCYNRSGSSELAVPYWEKQLLVFWRAAFAKAREAEHTGDYEGLGKWFDISID